MANKVKLTEADLNRIVKKVIKEQTFVQDAANAVGGAIKSGANSVYNAAKSIGNSITSPSNTASQKAQRSQGARAEIKSAMANARIKSLASTLKQYTPQEIAAAQKLNAGGAASTTPARPQPGPARPQPQGSRAVTSTGTTPVKPQP